MDINEVIKIARSMHNEREAIAFAGKLIADAIDRYTEAHKASIESQLKAADKSVDLIKIMMNVIKKESGEDEPWRESLDDED